MPGPKAVDRSPREVLTKLTLHRTARRSNVQCRLATLRNKWYDARPTATDRDYVCRYHNVFACPCTTAGMEDTWASRDLVVLRYLVERFDDYNTNTIQLEDIEPGAGLDPDAVRRALL